VEHLPANDLDQFRKWLEAFEAAKWDQKLKSDISRGKLNFLINEAQSEYASGKTQNIFPDSFLYI